MDLQARAIADLANNAEQLRAAFAGFQPEELTRRPASGGWSPLEVMHHLRDEEHEDFPLRIRMTLEDPNQPWPPIDPEGWAVSRRYNEAQPDSILAEFLEARRHNLDWLRLLKQPDWDLVHAHPQGDLSARQLLLCWLAHDLLHLRQLLRLRWHLLELQRRSPEDLYYAGSW